MTADPRLIAGVREGLLTINRARELMELEPAGREPILRAIDRIVCIREEQGALLREMWMRPHDGPTRRLSSV